MVLVKKQKTHTHRSMEQNGQSGNQPPQIYSTDFLQRYKDNSMNKE